MRGPTLSNLQQTWEELGRDDPLFAILTHPDKRGRKWGLREFFETGGREISEVITYIHALGIDLKRGAALDFGCGVGRITQALAPYFAKVVGVDIAKSMVDQANAYNRYGEKCVYVLNADDNLRVFSDETFDLIYSNITLQHMCTELSGKYIREFARLLAKGGVLIMQLPGQPRLYARFLPIAVRNYLRKVRGIPDYEMHGRKKEEVMELLQEIGVSLRDVVENHDAGPNWTSFRYCAIKL